MSRPKRLTLDGTSLDLDALSPVPYRVGYAQDSLVLSVRGPAEQTSVPERPFQLGFNISRVTVGDTPSRGKGPVKVLAIALEGEAAGGKLVVARLVFFDSRKDYARRSRECAFLHPNQHSRGTYSAVFSCIHCLPIRCIHAVL